MLMRRPSSVMSCRCSEWKILYGSACPGDLADLTQCAGQYLRIDDLLGVHGRLELAVFREKLYRVVKDRSVAAVLRPGTPHLDIGCDRRGDDVFGHIGQMLGNYRLENFGVRVDHAKALQQLGDVRNRHLFVLLQPLDVAPVTGAAY